MTKPKRTSFPAGGAAAGAYESAYWDELEFEFWYGANAFGELRDEAAVMEVKDLMAGLEREQAHELRRAKTTLSRLSDIINRLETIPQVILDGTVSAHAHLVVVRVDLPSRYTHYFVRSKKLSEAASHHQLPVLPDGLAACLYFRKAAATLLAELCKLVPSPYISICGNGYSRVTKHREIDLIAEPKGYGPPPWPAVVPLIQNKYKTYTLKLRHASEQPETFDDHALLADPRHVSDALSDLYGPSALKATTERWSTVDEYPDDGQLGSYKWSVDGGSALGGGFSSAQSSNRQRSLSYYSAPPKPPRRFSLLPQDEVPRLSRHDPLMRRRSSLIASGQSLLN